jgi:hypothetical protein
MRKQDFIINISHIRDTIEFNEKLLNLKIFYLFII